MDIVLLHYAAPPIVGGVEHVIGEHARLMMEAGHQVRILAGRGAQTDPRIPFISLPLVDSREAEVLAVKRQLDGGRVPPEFDPLSQRIEAQLLDSVRTSDWLIAHNVCSLNKNLPLTAALHRICTSRSRPQFILWQHDLAWTTPRYRSELHEGYPWDLLRTDWPRAHQVVVSQARRGELAELLGVPTARIRVIPNGIDVPGFLKLESQTQNLVTKLRLFSASPLVLLPVRITARKNIELALKVLVELKRDFKSAKLVVTGPLGPHNEANVQYFEHLVSLRGKLGADDSAHFLAEITEQIIPDEVVADLYRIADVLFFPSREEGFGIPVLEAALAGIPVFCADIGPLRELGGSQVNYFSADDDPVQIAASIRCTLETSAAFGLRKRVMRDYRWEQIYAAHIAPLLSAAKAD